MMNRGEAFTLNEDCCAHIFWTVNTPEINTPGFCSSSNWLKWSHLSMFFSFIIMLKGQSGKSADVVVDMVVVVFVDVVLVVALVVLVVVVVVVVVLLVVVVEVVVEVEVVVVVVVEVVVDVLVVVVVVVEVEAVVAVVAVVSGFGVE